MLVLGRETHQKIVIVVPPSHRETVIETTVVEAKSGYVRTGFDAPDDVVIDRMEVYRDKQRKAAEMAREAKAAQVRPEMAGVA